MCMSRDAGCEEGVAENGRFISDEIRTSHIRTSPMERAITSLGHC